MTEEFDPFKGSSGLMDDVDITFTNCAFVKDPMYTDKDNGGVMVPVFQAELVSDDAEPNRQLFSIGKGWKIEGNGAKVVRESGPPKGFNNSSYIQVFLNKLMEELGAAGDLRGRWEDTGASPMEAAFWEGLKVHAVQEETKGFDGKPTGKTRLMPTEFLGFEGASPAKGGGKSKVADDEPAEEKATPAKKAPAKKAAAKKAAATPPEMSEYAKAREAVGAEKVAEIRAIADSAEDVDSFVAECYASIEGIDDSAEIMALVDDTDSEESIWAEAVRDYEASQA